ncbi:MAG: MoaD/ThiS family protein [Chloroflexota bacterium]
MEINLTLHGILRDYLPRKQKGKTTLTLAEGTTVADIVTQLKIKQNVSAAIDGNTVAKDYALQDGQHLNLFRLIAGG